MCITILSLISAVTGVLSGQSQDVEQRQFLSIYGEKVTLHGKGIYQNDSVSLAAQGIAQDMVTLALGIPLLIISLIMARRGLLKGRLLLTGTLSYFLYAYTSYSFLSMYNSLFLMYVMLMSMSLFGFILCVMSFDLQELKDSFNPKLPVKFIGGFQLFVAFTLIMLWLGRIVPPLVNGTTPAGLEHYTTLVIQAMDLGIVVPAALLSGILIIKRKNFGYLLSSVIIIKGLTMLTAITAMIIGMIMVGAEVSLVEIIVFPVYNLIAVFCLILLLRNINEKAFLYKSGDYSV
jgi:hypothetical protein